MVSKRSEIARTLQNAEASCQAAGVRLTTKRQRTLSILLNSESPISAYELVERYQASYGESLTAMSAYRMLGFLVKEELAHKLQSVNKYTACRHINCDHSHELPQFLICDACDAVSEIGIRKDTLSKLRDGVGDTGFRLNEQQLELHGLCKACQQ